MLTPDDFKNLIQIQPAGQGFTLEDLAARLANIFLTVAGIIAFAYLIYAGILYMTAGGNADQAKKAQTAFINVVIGIIIISLSYVIIRSAANFAQIILK